MKNLFTNGIIVLLIIAALYIIFLRECKKPEPCPADGEILVPKTTWDAIQALANKPPKVTHDTVWMEGKTIYLPATPLPKPKLEVKDSTNIYSDSLVKKDIDVHYRFKVKGILLDRTWAYSPIVERIKVDSTVYVPQIVDRPVKVPQNGLYGYITAGGNAKSFLFGGGLDFITKKNTELGYMYQRFGSDGFHSLKLGIKFGK
jgi:hypothetical protein